VAVHAAGAGVEAGVGVPHAARLGRRRRHPHRLGYARPDIARHVINTHFDPHLLSQAASYDVASNVWPALAWGQQQVKELGKAGEMEQPPDLSKVGGCNLKAWNPR